MHVLLLTLLAQGALAQVAVINAAITSVGDALTKLDTGVKGLTTDLNSAQPLLTAAQSMQDVLKKATADVQAAQPISLTDALQLQTTAQTLGTTVNTTLNDLVAKKPVLDQLGVTAVAVQQLQTQRSGSTALVNAIVSKVPAAVQSIAQQQIAGLNAPLDNAIAKLSVGLNGTATSGATGPGTSGAAKVSSARRMMERRGKIMPQRLPAYQ